LRSGGERGQDAHRVRLVLVERIQGRLPRLDLGELNLPMIAGAISDGTFSESWL